MGYLNAAKLEPDEVQQIRHLFRCGFSKTTIADAFGVCQRSVANIIKGRSWYHLPEAEPKQNWLGGESAQRLRITSPRRLTSDQRAGLEKLKRQIEADIDAQAEREGLARTLLFKWTHRSRKAEQRDDTDIGTSQL